MRALSLTRICWFVLRASTALVLTVAPYHLTFDGTAKVVPADVRAEDDGGESEGGSGSGSGSGSNSGSGGSGSNSGSSGSGSGSGGSSGGTGPGNSHVNPQTGDKVSIHGSTIKVVHPDGLREKIENGRFVMKDALGRTIVERAATAADLARLKRL
ncbi:hypothetical protein [Mesorhizobium qingshengii]|uniref:Uncharacterized protein n=1 Tax=Mesorhizobium qingshengii TaxID=1165689 RepID=A0A1G5WAI5_9HYPH|nr:hypothetical protein [Mesorhizobium qingshengii]SDA55083.1 hypothetical protein SAMN02927914_01327 [Mesorhizobium qingshengii]